MFTNRKLSFVVFGFATVLIIGVRLVQAEPLKVYLLGGQSNMVGWITANSDLPSNLQQPQTDVQIYHAGSWGYLRPGLGYSSSRFGPEVTFGRDMADAQPGENIALVKYAVGGTNLANDWRAPDANGQGAGPRYTAFMNTVTSAMASLEPSYEPDIVGMIWMQGESDAYHEGDLSKAEAYELNLTNFIQSIRSDLSEPNMPFVIGQISDSPVWTHGDIVRQAQLNVSQTVSNTALVITSDLPRDALHYTSAGTMTLGSRFADATQNLEFAASKASSSSDGTTLSWWHTIGNGENRILVVGIAGEDDTAGELVIDSVTYNDIDMELIEGTSQLVYYSPGMYMKTELYYLLDSNLPSSGTYVVEVTYSGNVSSKCAGAISLANVEQQAAEAVATSSNEDLNTISTDITTQTDGTWVVDIVGCDNQGSFTADENNGQVERFDISSSNSTGAGSTKLVASAGPTTISWSHSGASRLVHSVAAFAAVPRIISGYILEPNNMPIEDVSVSADNGGVYDVTEPNGYYEALVPYGWCGTVKPEKAGYVFGPPERTYDSVITDQLGQDYKDISFYDLDGDGYVDWYDVAVIAENWAKTDPDVEGGDINGNGAGDGVVDFRDFAELALAW